MRGILHPPRLGTVRIDYSRGSVEPRRSCCANAPAARLSGRDVQFLADLAQGQAGEQNVANFRQPATVGAVVVRDSDLVHSNVADLDATFVPASRSIIWTV
jgi:hypothetical protein